SDEARAAWAAIREMASEGTVSDVLAAVAEMTKALQAEMQSLEKDLMKTKGGQKADLARSAAEKHKARGLNYEQIADALAFDKIVPETYTAENVRDLLRKKGKGRE